jgi:hypothetical protein
MDASATPQRKRTQLARTKEALPPLALLQARVFALPLRLRSFHHRSNWLRATELEQVRLR